MTHPKSKVIPNEFGKETEIINGLEFKRVVLIHPCVPNLLTYKMKILFKKNLENIPYYTEEISLNYNIYPINERSTINSTFYCGFPNNEFKLLYFENYKLFLEDRDRNKLSLDFLRRKYTTLTSLFKY